MKSVEFLGDSRKVLRGFPPEIRREAGYQLDRIQRGLRASDTKPMPQIGTGVEEIRLWDGSGTYRIIYIARLIEVVYVLHAFQKKTRATSKRDLALAGERLRELMQERK
jgi:phage-related protein